MERCDTYPYVEGKCEFKKFLPVFLPASFYQKFQQTMKIQEIPRKSKVLGALWIFLKFLESARFVGFSGKSLVVLDA